MSEGLKGSVEVVQHVWPDWEIRETIGSGAFATVYRAQRKDRIAGEKDSAIKVIRIPHDDGEWARLLAEGKTPEQARAYYQEIVDDSLKEIRAMEELSGHTNIVNILDYKRYHEPEKNVWYILIRMELLRKIDPAGFDEKEVIRLGKDVCTALTICRRKNIVHRDVSLDNIFIHDGSYKLGDFGVAKVLEGTLSGMQSVAGKPLYMAPEIYNAALTDPDVDSAARVDIYSLGILMYRLCHRMNYPFEDPDGANVTAPARGEAFRRRVIEGEALPPPRYASEGLAKVILRACEADPDRRFASAEEMYRALLDLEAPPAPARTRNRRPLFIAALALVCAALVFAGAWAGVRAWKKRKTGTETYHIILTAPDSMSVRDFNAVIKEMKNRLDIFTRGRGRYKWTQNDDRVDLTLPKEAFAGEKADKVLNSYLVRPAVLYAVDLANTSVTLGAQPADAVIEIPREDIESLVMKTGEEGRRIELTLSDGFTARYGETMAAWGRPVFAQDCRKYSGVTWYYLTPEPAGDGKTWYFKEQSAFFDLLYHNLTHDPLPDALDLTIDMNDLTNWQDPETAAAAGAMQRPAGEIPEPNVTFTVSAGTTAALSDGEKLDAEKALKARLDALGVPYAVGVTDGYPLEAERYQERTYFTVKAPAGRLGVPLMQAMVSNGLALRCGLTELDISFSDLMVSEVNDDGSFTLVPDETRGSRDSTVRSLLEMKEACAGQTISLWLNNNSLYNNYPLFAVGAEDIKEDGSFTVRQLCLVADGQMVTQPLGQDTAWLGGFMKAMAGAPRYPVAVSFGEYQADAAAFGIPFDPGAGAMEKAAREIHEKTLVEETLGWLDSAVNVTVTLYLPADDAFPEKAPQIIREIYEKLGFPELFSKEMRFELRGTEEELLGTVRFVKIFKRPTADPEGEKGYIYVQGFFQNRLSGEYRDRFVAAVNGMEFYRDLTHDETRWE